MSAASALEHELRGLNDEIRKVEAEASEKHAEAEAFVLDLRKRGENPLIGENFERVDKAYLAADELREQAAELRRRAEAMMERAGHGRPAHPGSAELARKASTMAGRVMESAGYAAFKAGANDLPNTEILTRDEVLRMIGTDLLATTTDITGVPLRDRQDFIVPIPVRPVRALDLISVGTTDGDTIIYVEETTRTDAAAETALGTAYAEAAFVYTERTSNVRDIGTFVPAHRSNLMDYGILQSLLTGRVTNDVLRRFESQIVSGNGTAPNLKGILNTAGIGTKAKAAAEPRIETLHKCITNIRLNFFDEPDGVLLHPTDFESVIFEKDADGDYLLGDPGSLERPTVWGKPMIPSAVIAQGTGLVGAWKQGAQAWLRQGLEVRVSDEHSTYFTERRVAILGEIRAAFAAWQPKAFCQATGL